MATNRTRFDFEGFATISENFQKLLTSDAEMEKRIRELIGEELKVARDQVAATARNEIKSDPRQAWRAVRHSVYKKILGGQVNILAKKRGTASMTNYSPTRKLDRNPHQRGGNRLPRRENEWRHNWDKYEGSSRGFILRVLDSGTTNRHNGWGNRGSIAPRHWFSNAGNNAMDAAAQRLADILDDEIIKQAKLQ